MSICIMHRLNKRVAVLSDVVEYALESWLPCTRTYHKTIIDSRILHAIRVLGRVKINKLHVFFPLNVDNACIEFRTSCILRQIIIMSIIDSMILEHVHISYLDTQNSYYFIYLFFLVIFVNQFYSFITTCHSCFFFIISTDKFFS